MKYNITIRTLHLLLALIIISMLILGFYMRYFAEAHNISELFRLHKNIGIIALFLVLFRLFIRLLSTFPKMPDNLSKLSTFSAKIIMPLGMYTGMIMLPMTGYFMSCASGKTPNFFGIQLPNLLGTNLENIALFAKMHFFFAIFMSILIILHFCVFLKYLIIDKVNLLKRIL
ncbi:MAG: cytochrome b/b6 domain-containing protein [Proteobacteria bacterium]|nr:cytochrome b/b6 domain-containing protein [Pseudomonadota bacterium]